MNIFITPVPHLPSIIDCQRLPTITGVNLLIYKLTTIISFPLTSTATHFTHKIYLKSKSVFFNAVTPARNVEILIGS